VIRSAQLRHEGGGSLTAALLAAGRCVALLSLQNARSQSHYRKQVTAPHRRRHSGARPGM